MATTLPAVVAEFGEALVRLAATLSAASEAQWQASHTPTPREDTTERAKGGHGDPTLAIVVDDRRVDLREEVLAAERVLTSAAAYARRVDARLQRSLDVWAGERGV